MLVFNLRKRPTGLLIAGVALALFACGDVQDGAPDADDDNGDQLPDADDGNGDPPPDGDDGELPPDADRDADTGCDPGEALRCDDDVLITCGDDGDSEEERDCPLGCDEASTQCVAFEPSNDVGTFFAEAEEAPDVEIDSPGFIDTDNGTITVGGDNVSVPTELLENIDGGADIRVFMVGSLDILADTEVDGSAALAFVADDDITIEALLDLSAEEDELGPGALIGSAAGPGGVCPEGGSSGGGGGPFGGDGGSGGTAGQVSGGFGGPAQDDFEDLIPLRGGHIGREASTRGNRIAGAGGAVQLVSRTRVVVRDGGAIGAGGAAGGTGSGGGSGGGILIEAPIVQALDGGTAVAANGGGGGCAQSDTPAEDGRLDDQPAGGCETSSSHGDGGAGGAGSEPDGENGESVSPGYACDGSQQAFVGGGGGGGAGHIRINNESGSFSPQGGATVSPDPSVGEIAIP